MKRLIVCVASSIALTCAPLASGDIILSLFRTGDATKSSAFTVTPGETFAIDAEIASTGTDELNTYFAPFLATPLAVSAATFIDQTGVPPYRNSASGYVFGDDEFLGDTSILSPFSGVFDGSLLPRSSVSLGSTPMLLVRMELAADALAIPGESILLSFEPTLLASLPAFTDAVGTPITIASAPPATLTFTSATAVPEPRSFFLILIAVICMSGAAMKKRFRATSQDV